MIKNTVLAALVLFCLCFSAACSRREIRGEPKTIDDLNGRVLGMLVSPIMLRPVDIRRNVGFLPSEVRNFPTSNELVTALKTKRVDGMVTTVETSKFLISADERLTILPARFKPTGLGMILRSADEELLKELNMAIARLKREGTLERLHEKYVTDVTVNKLADTPDKLPEIPGVETILVGINGDLPPYDYISVDGKPAGFNVALMSEISRVLEKNIKFVTIPSETRYSALLSGNSRRMDLFFWFYGELEAGRLVLTDMYAEVEECILARK
jgi:polar amino acid transport system substrate-binding protein